MIAAACSFSACSRALFHATEGSEFNESTRNILHFTESSFEIGKLTFESVDLATSRSWDMGRPSWWVSRSFLVGVTE